MLAKFFSRLEEAIISLLLVTMTILVFIEVVLRFGFDTSLLWSDEATLYLASWFVLFGASYGIKVGAHIGVDTFVKMLPDTPRRIAGLLSIGLGLLYCGLFLYGGWIYLAKLKMIDIQMDDIPIPKWTTTSILFIGFVMLSIRLSELFWRVATGKQYGFSQVNEAEESMQLAKDAQLHLAQSRLGDGIATNQSNSKE